MIELLVTAAALVLVLSIGVLGSRAGAPSALSRMLGAVVSLLVAIRYWFPAARLIGEHDSASVPVLAITAFWMLFILTDFIFLKLSDASADEEFESVLPDPIGRILGALFGLVTGAAFAIALVMTFDIAATRYLPTYQQAALPVPIDTLSQAGFRFIEKRIAQVPESDSAHTPLPRLPNIDTADPGKFWK